MPRRGSSSSGFNTVSYPESGFAQNLRLQDKLHEFLCPLPLHHEFAAFVKNHVQFVLGRGKSRVGNFAKLVGILPEMFAQ